LPKQSQQIESEGINKADLTREEFLKHAYDWTDKYGGCNCGAKN
jgi:valyl-tRNA synthetase